MWDLFEGKHLFYGNDPDGKGYSTRAHLAEVMGILGPPPLDLLQRGKRSHEFFTDDGKYSVLTWCPLQRLTKTMFAGKWEQDIEVLTNLSLETSETYLEGRNKDLFMTFMRGMLQWRPEDRKTAKDLLQDPWLNDRVE